MKSDQEELMTTSIDRWARTDNAAYDNLQRLRIYTDIPKAEYDALERTYEAASNGHDFDALRRAADAIEVALELNR